MYETVRAALFLAALALNLYLEKHKRRYKRVCLAVSAAILALIVAVPIEGYLFAFDSLEASFHYSHGAKLTVQKTVEDGDHGIVFYTDGGSLKHEIYSKNVRGWNVNSPIHFRISANVEVGPSAYLSRQNAGSGKVLLLITEVRETEEPQVIHSVVDGKGDSFPLCEVRRKLLATYYHYKFVEKNAAGYDVIINGTTYHIK